MQIAFFIRLDAEDEGLGIELMEFRFDSGEREQPNPEGPDLVEGFGFESGRAASSSSSSSSLPHPYFIQWDGEPGFRVEADYFAERVDSSKAGRPWRGGIGGRLLRRRPRRCRSILRRCAWLFGRRGRCRRGKRFGGVPLRRSCLLAAGLSTDPADRGKSLESSIDATERNFCCRSRWRRLPNFGVFWPRGARDCSGSLRGKTFCRFGNRRHSRFGNLRYDCVADRQKNRTPHNELRWGGDLFIDLRLPGTEWLWENDLAAC